MNWERITVEDGTDVAQWMVGRVGPFEIEIWPPWDSDETDADEWLLVVTAAGSREELLEDVAESKADAKRKALGWLNRQFRDWQDDIDNEMAKIRREEP